MIQKTKAENWISQSHFLTTVNLPFLWVVSFRHPFAGVTPASTWMLQAAQLAQNVVLDRSSMKVSEPKKGWGCFRVSDPWDDCIFTYMNQGCRFVPDKHFRKLSPRDDTPDTTKILVKPGFGGFDSLGQIYQPCEWLIFLLKSYGFHRSFKSPFLDPSWGFEVSQTFAQILAVEFLAVVQNHQLLMKRLVT